MRGWLKALDEKDGHVAWTAYSTGPDSECLIGSDFHPFYDSDKGKDLGVTTWPRILADRWRHRLGMDLLRSGSESHLLRHQQPRLVEPRRAPGDNKWSCGIFARNPDNGQARWFYQWSPHDLFDHDGVNETILLEMPIDGQQRKVLVTPQRNGYVYVMDRATGQVLSATPFVRITSSTGVDLEDRKAPGSRGEEAALGKVIRDIAPASPGGKDWQPSAFSPRTGYLYIPHQNLTMDFEAVEANYIAGTPYVGANEKMYGDPGGVRGEFCAWDPINKRRSWWLSESFPVWSGTVVHGWRRRLLRNDGRLVQSRRRPKRKRAVEAEGRLRNLRQPVTYRGPDGKQYVAVLSGIGGWAGALVSGDLDARDPTAALGFVNAVPDLPQHTIKGGTLYVFALP